MSNKKQRLPEQKDWPHAWYAVCRSQALRRRPLAVRAVGQSMVLFRDASGVAKALLDRCPHRHAPLSLGRCVEGELRCAYHGWQFDGQGHCRKVPGLLDAQPLPKAKVPGWPLREQDGLCWVWPFAEAPAGEPPRHAARCLNDASYQHVWFRYRMAAPWHAVAENILDVPHTAHVHAGLFRRAEMRRRIEVCVAPVGEALEARYLGEKPPSGWLGRLLAPDGGTIDHWDRFFWPATAQVEYALGGMHWLGTHFLTPEDDRTTLAHLLVSRRMPGFWQRFPLSPMVQGVGRFLLHQDAGILRAQTANMQAPGDHPFASSPLDALSLGIQRLTSIVEPQAAEALLCSMPEQRYSALV